MATVVGIFRHSGDAHLAAAHLLDAYALTDEQLDVIGPGDAWRLNRPGLTDGEQWLMAAALGGIGEAGFPPAEDPVGRRWSLEAIYGEKTLVVARTYDEDMAREMAEDLKRTGAETVDILTY